MSVEDTTADHRERALTIRQFCILENIAVATYYKMRRLGYGPDEMRVPGTALVRITQRARHDWHARIEQLGKSEGAELEAARRRAQTAAAGKRAAESPLHVSQRRKAVRHGTRARQLTGGVQ
jgi:hypothetical protein